MRNNKLYNKCIDCEKSVSFYAKRCRKCHWKQKREHSQVNYNKGKVRCIDCSKIINYSSKRCLKCNAKYMSVIRRGKNNPAYIDGRTTKIKNIRKQKGLVRHHLYGKKHTKIMILKRKTHTKLHHEAYFYILDKYGKKGINNYIKWFDRKFGLKVKK